MQIALWFAGLRGAMSFALVEHIPLYDSFSGEGTRLKPELKAMTSASIMFTVFVLGGYTYYIMQSLGIAPSNKRTTSGNAYEITALINKGHESESDEEEIESALQDNFDTAAPVNTPGKATAFRRQRHAQLDSMLTI
jgi:NhaP-type Na+/H+ or K+/H+ antiporter